MSVIKNAIQKVMKIRDPETLGDNIVVQGGTFYNDAVLRSFELVVGKEVIRPDIAGLMGAYGVALLSKEQYEANLDMEYTSTLANLEELDKLNIKLTHTRCNGCENKCKLTINKFNNGKTHVSGNRCERGAGIVTGNSELPNLIKYKAERIFGYEPLLADAAKRGKVGIPRVLNMYENYPFWFTFFTRLGYQVVLSPLSNHNIYSLGIESIPSESECYPAKLAHGHVSWLIHNQADFIFYPCVPFERNEFPDSNNHYNCPIVTSYAVNIKNNVD